jgi:hypothetical protein
MPAFCYCIAIDSGYKTGAFLAQICGMTTEQKQRKMAGQANTAEKAVKLSDRGIIAPSAPASEADEDPDLQDMGDDSDNSSNTPFIPKGLQQTGTGFWLGGAILLGLGYYMFKK